MNRLKIKHYRTQSGVLYTDLPLTYEVFGPALGSAPIVLVNHALTGNSKVTGKNGWWSSLIGNKKTISTEDYTVLVFNVPGNGYDGFLIDQYKDFVVYDIATLFLEGLKLLSIKKVFAIIGSSLGGSISWQLAQLAPKLASHLIVVATHWKANDWVMGLCKVQDQILQNSKTPVHDARMHAMTFYRSPQSFKEKFNESFNFDQQMYNIHSWLLYHGKKLQDRFQLKAYRLMNYLLMNVDISKGYSCFNEATAFITSKIILVGIDSDRLYLDSDIQDTYMQLKHQHKNVEYHQIKSIHGHDAFLIEYDQLNKVLTPIF